MVNREVDGIKLVPALLHIIQNKEKSGPRFSFSNIFSHFRVCLNTETYTCKNDISSKNDLY